MRHMTPLLGAVPTSFRKWRGATDAPTRSKLSVISVLSSSTDYMKIAPIDPGVVTALGLIGVEA